MKIFCPIELADDFSTTPFHHKMVSLVTARFQMLYVRLEKALYTSIFQLELIKAFYDNK